MTTMTNVSIFQRKHNHHRRQIISTRNKIFPVSLMVLLFIQLSKSLHHHRHHHQNVSFVVSSFRPSTKMYFGRHYYNCHHRPRRKSFFMDTKTRLLDNRNNCFCHPVLQKFDGSSISTRLSSTSTSTNDERHQELQNQLDWIAALEERNAAQIDSFIDEQDKWDSMEEWERELLSNKQNIQKQYDELCSNSSSNSSSSSSSNDARQRAEETFQLLARRGRSWKRLQHLVDLALLTSPSSSSSSNGTGTTTSTTTIADIGTDHGLLAIGLVLTGYFKKVIGVDVSREALENGALTLLEGIAEQQQQQQHHDSEFILSQDRLDFRVGDGLRGLRNDEIVDTVCMAGMGVKTMIKILSTLDDTDKAVEEDQTIMTTASTPKSNPLRLIDKVACRNLILQPTNSRPRQLIELYDELQSSGWTLQDERIESLSGRWYITALFSRSNIPGEVVEDIEGRKYKDLPCSKLVDQSSVDIDKATLEGYISHHSRWLPHSQIDLRWLAEFGDRVHNEEEKD